MNKEERYDFELFNRLMLKMKKKFTQLIVPKKFRTKVLALAHESLISGHLGTSRTNGRVLAELYWPGVQADVKRFVSHATFVRVQLQNVGLQKYLWVRCH